MIRGIGPVYAKKMVKAFGEKVFDVIEAEPDRLREVTGIGAVRAKRITDAWAEQKIIREIMVFLHSNGVGTARAVRIFKTYGADAVQVMTENPYRLARDIRGIGSTDFSARSRFRALVSFAQAEQASPYEASIGHQLVFRSWSGCRSSIGNIRQDIVERADGIPLFAEEMTKTRVGIF